MVGGETLGARFEGLFTRILRSLDVIKEEHLRGGFGGPGPNPGVVMSGEALLGADFASSPEAVEYERFSPDSSWMPRVVMIAKSTYVWLDQLSKWYGRDISRLDEIPDEELDELAARGFVGLWLIGLWERSEASKRIKNMRGNPDAVASAYSLYDYTIAADLGGDAAYENLRDRAWARGIRLASDMVPNHMGVDSRWVVEHPDWFLSLDHAPYPAYTFNGPDLSQDKRVGIYLEDHYYDSTDAAVVFKRVDHHTGDARYIYHGNDGTSMPWNDTAQLDYLEGEVREGVIQTILHVARKFPIIRFDAAMTLAKKHIQRLWFPTPGSGGAIPSRTQYGSMTDAEFDSLIPEEFWREVVDRVAQEVPDTLLLAEAFWMMEGYFVRTLGMHRVYNSAFMHMLKQERNDEYRQSIKNVLEFDPDILKRYVNFMNNPDEETALAQFGKDDKYFGVCVVMSTMPGLPMFGHGQVEGFSEKYGMEYKRAKLDEQPDSWLIDRHRREVFPLLHRRNEFAEVENFLLYDVHAPGGSVNENVFAYSNRYGDKASLVVFNNKFETARGWIKRSSPYVVKEGDTKRTETRDLAEGLGLRAGDRDFAIFKDGISGLEYLQRSRDVQEQGFYLELGAFKYQVFLDFHEVEDNEWSHFARLHEELGGRGVRSVLEAVADLGFMNLHREFASLFHERLLERAEDMGEAESASAVLEPLYRDFLQEAKNHGFSGDLETATTRFVDLARRVALFPSEALTEDAVYVEEHLQTSPRDRAALLAWAALEPLDNPDLYAQWRLAGALGRRAEALEFSQDDRDTLTALVPLLLRHGFKREVVQDGAEGFVEGVTGAISGIVTGTVSSILSRATEAFASRESEGADDAVKEEASSVKNSADDSADEDQITASTDTAENNEEDREAQGVVGETGEDDLYIYKARPLLERLLEDDDALRFLEVNEYEGVRWFNRERYHVLKSGLLRVALVQASDTEEVERMSEMGLELDRAEERSEYRVDGLLARAEPEASKESSTETSAEETSTEGTSTQEISMEKTATGDSADMPAEGADETGETDATETAEREDVKVE